MITPRKLQCDSLTPDELETVIGLLYALDLIRAATTHGSIHLNIVDGRIEEWDIEQRIRPKYGAPWKPKGHN